MKPNVIQRTTLFGIIGHPVGHSLSPLLHNTTYKALGLHCNYKAFDVELTSLGAALRNFKALDFSGLNVTIPYKEIIMPLLDGFDDKARDIGAVNTIVMKEGKAIGYNTDVAGVMKSLEPYADGFEGKHALVIGAGGAARAVVYALIKYFDLATITITSRTQQRAQYLVQSFKPFTTTTVRTLSFLKPALNEAVEEASLIINATPIGMFPNVNASPFHTDIAFRKDHIVMDLIYHPLQTALLKNAHKAGARTISGLEMFLHQGAQAFELWTGETMPLPKVRKVIEKALQK